MGITIIYYITSFNDKIKESLKSLLCYDSEGLELIIIDANDNVDLLDKDYINIFKKAKVKIIYVNENVGHSFGYNLALTKATNDYVYFARSITKFTPIFFKSLNKKINSNVKNDLIYITNSTSKISKKNIDRIFYKELSLKYFIFNRKFLLKNEIFFKNYHHYHNLFIMSALLKSQNITSICYNSQTSKDINSYTYNVYDILKSPNEMIKLIDASKFENDSERDIYMSSIPMAVLYEFLLKMFNSNNDITALTSAISNAYSCINGIYSDYKSNTFIVKNSKTNKIFKYLLNYECQFKYVKKAFLEWKTLA